MENEPIILDETSKAAVHAAKNAAQAVEIARQEQLDKATITAAERAAHLATERIAEKVLDEQRFAEIVRTQMQHVLETGSEKGREAIIARIPYVCEDIRGIKLDLTEIKKVTVYLPLIQKLLFGVVTIVLTAVAVAIVALVINK